MALPQKTSEMIAARADGVPTHTPKHGTLAEVWQRMMQAMARVTRRTLAAVIGKSSSFEKS